MAGEPELRLRGDHGLGPCFRVNSFDEKLGLWVRTIALSAVADTFVLSVVDGEGWLGTYKNKCDDCGAKQIGESPGRRQGARRARA